MNRLSDTLAPLRAQNARVVLESGIKCMWRYAAVILFMIPAALAQAAEQNFSVQEDGLVRFKASVSGITRVSVVGDRIASIVNDDGTSVYQVKNDEQTGDIFLRYVGPSEMPDKEGGYIVTEKGYTVAYEVLPIRSSTQTALIKIKPHNEESHLADGPPNSGVGDFADTSFGAGDGYAAQLTAATRETIMKKIRSPAPKTGRHGTLVSSHRMGDLVGEVRVASAGKAGRLVKEQDFFKAGVLSVWVQRKSLTGGERSWVVVVRKR